MAYSPSNVFSFSNKCFFQIFFILHQIDDVGDEVDTAATAPADNFAAMDKGPGIKLVRDFR